MTRRRNRPRFILAVLVLAALTIVTIDSRGNGSSTLHSVRNGVHSALSSVQDGIHDALRPVGNFLAGAVNYGSVKAENARLRQQLAEAQAAEPRALYEQAQSQQVLAYEHIPYADQYRTVVAAVTNQSGSNFEAVVTIDKGTSSGIADNEPVITPAGLAGQVTDATADSATVTLITDPTLFVGVGLPEGKVGTANSEGDSGPLSISAIGSTPEVKQGEILYTDGVTPPELPPGIPVGKVTSVKGVSGNATPTITARPLARTASLSYLTVILSLPA